MLRIVVGLCLLATPMVAEPAEPERGSDLRRAVLDAVRVVVVEDLGAPIEFVVTTLLVEGDLAFAQVNAQRPGGGSIDIAQTPLVLRDGIPTDLIDGPRTEAFLKRGADGWFVVDHATGATDMWWFGYDCQTYAAFLPDAGC